MNPVCDQRSVARRPVAAVVFRYVHHYRREFYEQLRRCLNDQGVDFRLIAGQPGPRESAKHDCVRVPWAESIRNRYWSVGGYEVCWQPCLRRVWNADLVIVEQASRLVLNYALLAGRTMGGPKLGLWGQGAHVQPHRASRAGESVKSLASRHVDWWFAYNDASVAVVTDLGFPADRITNVQNAVDTRALRDLRNELSDVDIAASRSEFGLQGSHVGVFAGSLYTDKRLPFLIAAADRVRAALSDFELLIIGAGSEEEAVRQAAKERPWLRYAGALYGRDKVRAMSTASAYLIPGAVGLGVLDAFALGLPPVTTRIDYHGHEVAYIVPGENGLMVEDAENPASYALEVVRLLTDDELLEHLRRGCGRAARQYTIEAMTERFARGICDALGVTTALNRTE
jgi:glycosyltransferase involved in cell wall biosynthesis